MFNFINDFFTWVSMILNVWLNTEIDSGIKFYHVFVFLFLVAIIFRFISKLVSVEEHKFWYPGRKKGGPGTDA